MSKPVWQEDQFPGCFGWPCLKTEYSGHVARIWQSSPHTTNEEWCYSIDIGPVRVMRGNRGTAKTAAFAALRRVAMKRVSCEN